MRSEYYKYNNNYFFAERKQVTREHHHLLRDSYIIDQSFEKYLTKTGYKGKSHGFRFPPLPPRILRYFDSTSFFFWLSPWAIIHLPFTSVCPLLTRAIWKIPPQKQASATTGTSKTMLRSTLDEQRNLDFSHLHIRDPWRHIHQQDQKILHNPMGRQCSI